MAKSRAAINAKRNYRKEAAYENKPGQVKNREARNRARSYMAKKGKVHPGDGLEVDHKKMLAEGGSKTNPKNLRVVTRRTNRKKQPKHKG